MDNFDYFGKTVGLILAMAAVGLIFAACRTSSMAEVDDTAGKIYRADGTVIHEIHPKPGVTCFVVYNSGISCIKD